MPAKNHTRHPQHVIDAAVKRHLDGESVAVLAKYYKMSKPGFYLWIDKYKRALLEKAARAEMTPQATEDAEVSVLRLQLQALRAENLMLKRVCYEHILKTGDFSMLSNSVLSGQPAHP